MENIKPKRVQAAKVPSHAKENASPLDALPSKEELLNTPNRAGININQLPQGQSNFNSRIYTSDNFKKFKKENNKSKKGQKIESKKLKNSHSGISIDEVKIKTKLEKDKEKEKSIASSRKLKGKKQNSSKKSSSSYSSASYSPSSSNINSNPNSITMASEVEQSTSLITSNIPSIPLEESSKYELNFISNFDTQSLRSNYTSDNSVNQINKYLKMKFDQAKELNNARIIAKLPLFYKLKDTKQNPIKIQTVQLKDYDTGKERLFPLYDDISTGFDSTLSKTIHERNHDDDLPTDEEQISNAKESAFSTLKEGLQMFFKFNQRLKIISGSKNMKRNQEFQKMLYKD